MRHTKKSRKSVGGSLSTSPSKRRLSASASPSASISKHRSSVGVSPKRPTSTIRNSPEASDPGSPTNSARGLDDNGTQPFVPFLSHLTDGCSVEDLDPSCCVPLCLSRDISENAVCKLFANINGDGVTDKGYDNCGESTLTGFVSGSPTSVVVPLVGDLHYLLDEYFLKIGKTVEDAKVLKEQHDTWYGIIDGGQLHAAIIRSIECRPAKWKRFTWKVFCLKPGHCIEEYRKLAIVQNERCKQANHFEPTLYELVKGLRAAHDHLFQQKLKQSRSGSRGVNVTHREVAHQYDGGNHDKNTTIKQAVSVAIRLSPRAIETIGSITNMYCVDAVLHCSDLNRRKLTSSEEVLSAYDCRLYKNFLCLSTLRGAVNFVNALKDGDEEAQVNTIHRARQWCELNDFKSLKPPVLIEQFKLAKLALTEESKFLSLIQKENWPVGMETTRDNLLRTTVFDEDLTINQGNDQDVLQCVWRSFKTCYPAQARSIEKELTQRSDSSSVDSPPVPDLPSPQPDGTSNAQEKEAECPEEERRREEAERKKKEEQERLKQVRLEAARRKSLRTKADSFLADSGISTHCMTADEFTKRVWKSGSTRFDLVLSTLPHGITDSEIKMIPSLCKTVLKPGSYVVFVVDESQFNALQQTFSGASFKVCTHSYKIIYDPKSLTVKRRRTIDFPQRQDDICFIAKTNGFHPNSFLPDFASVQDGRSPISQSSFASATNIPSCTNKLKMPKQNSPIFPHERSIDVFLHLLRLFSPAEGRVFDPFGGPLSVSLACLQSSRHCVSLGHFECGLKYAVGRLRVFATPHATMEGLETYIDDELDDDEASLSVPCNNTSGDSPNQSKSNNKFSEGDSIETQPDESTNNRTMQNNFESQDENGDLANGSDCVDDSNNPGNDNSTRQTDDELLEELRNGPIDRSDINERLLEINLRKNIDIDKEEVEGLKQTSVRIINDSGEGEEDNQNDNGADDSPEKKRLCSIMDQGTKRRKVSTLTTYEKPAKDVINCSANLQSTACRTSNEISDTESVAQTKENPEQQTNATAIIRNNSPPSTTERENEDYTSSSLSPSKADIAVADALLSMQH